MRRDEVSRNRSVLLTRWRGGATVVRERDAPSAPLPSDAVPALVSTLALPENGASSPNEAPSARDETTLLRRLEAEIRAAVPRATADTLCRILAAPLGAAGELTPEVRATLLSKLDLVEDVLDAVLLAGRGHGDEAESEREPP